MKQIIKFKKIENYEILTDTGWKDIDYVYEISPQRLFKIVTDDFELKCADKHIVFDIKFNEIFVDELTIGDIIQTINGPQIIYEILDYNTEILMYDLQLSENSDKRYFTNGILSHNSSCARILVEDTNCLRINCKKDRTIDIVRTKVDEFCSKYGIFAKRNTDGELKIKTILLEEFDGAASGFQDALNDVIEEYEKHVRFIATVNNLNKISKPMQSRFNCITFEPLNQKEKEYLHSMYIKYIIAIAKNVNFNITDEQVTKIINIKFPDLRAAIQLFQEVTITNDFDIVSLSNSAHEEIYNFILNGNNELTENYYYVLNNYRDRADELLKILGRPFVQYLMETNPDLFLDKGKEMLNLQKEYNAEYNNTLDPELHLISFVTKIKELLN
jgi:DNA polymerase III delta prime subunit